MQKNGFVYIITDQVGGKLSVGVTTDLSKRLHRLCTIGKQSMRSKSEQPRLVYVERWHQVLDALIRKQTLAKWPRAKKLELINQLNPVWRDLRRTWKKVV
jgi:putative endonuclease